MKYTRMRNGKSGTGYMELNTINKTGTWSETADRINSNFSKISIEVEEIKAERRWRQWWRRGRCH
ncbi:hypothetical protein NXY07_26150 [Phocaeicola dorei]|nr:hypothetical protein [Phocaeicola dorei]